VILNVLNRALSGGAVLIYSLFILMFLSCGSDPQTQHPEINSNEANASHTSDPHTQQSSSPAAGSLAEEIKNLTETGILSSMLHAIDTIRSRNLGNSEFGRMMSGICVTLIKLVYPDSPALLPAVDLPQTSAYTRIIREAERGVYTRPSSESADFLEHILPFIAVFYQGEDDINITVLRDLEKAARLQPASILPFYFSAVFYERAGRYNEAVDSYQRVLDISKECYPAQISIARIKKLTGNTQEAAAILSDLVVSYPDSMAVKREQAGVYFSQRDFSRALSVVDEILRSDPRDGEFLLLRASILIEQGQYSQANISLDSYASINASNRDYLFMRAKVQAEGNRSRDSAMNYLRSILRVNPNDAQVLAYAVTLLMESQRDADQSEGRELLRRLQQLGGSTIEVLNLSLRDAVRRESWREAQGFINQILQVRRTNQDLIDAYHIERGLGNNARALTFAQELYQRDTANIEFTGVYVSALIDNGRRDEASRLLESRINSVPSGTVKSNYYYLRSRVQTNEDAVLSDLRSSLFEDPRNLDAIIAMFMAYHNRREERRAVYYLRQALAISPNDSRLTRYEAEYASLLGRE